MRVAIDKNIINLIEDFTEFEYVYIYENETLDDLLSLNMHCIHKDYVSDIDVNLTDYNISCLRKAKFEDPRWKKPIERKNYK